MESQIAVNAVSNLIAAFNARLDVEESSYKRTTFQARKIELPQSLPVEEQDVKLEADIEPVLASNILPESPIIV